MKKHLELLKKREDVFLFREGENIFCEGEINIHLREFAGLMQQPLFLFVWHFKKKYKTSLHKFHRYATV